ncbi:MAG: choice-of-anchor tandem repeat GloVer-containing protein [Candidatus Cybelea sp.]
MLYGTTAGGGSRGYGTLFSITTSGSETVLHSFKGGSRDGATPLASLLDVKGMLDGTTASGGAYCSGRGGCGTVFSITTSGKETLLYSFKGGKTDGQNPYAGLINVNGKLYGTNNWAGANCKNGLACGTVFAVTPSGAETVLHSFSGYSTSDGAVPQAALLDVHGLLYGTTEYGGSGSSGGGTVFEISTSGKEHVLRSFDGYPDGTNPVAGLIKVKNTLYGTTQAGGSVYCPTSGYLGCGTVFALKLRE